MNLDDVRNITKISEQRLQDIINKNFKDIDKTRAHGFIKILERDLHLDLREWVQEYEYFLKNGTTENFTPNIESSLDYKDSVKNENSLPQVKTSTYNDFKPKDSKEKKSTNINNIEISTLKAKKSYKANVLLIAGGFFVLIVVFFAYFMNISTESNTKEIAKVNETQKQEIEDIVTQRYPKVSLGNALSGEDSVESNVDSNNVESTTSVDTSSSTKQNIAKSGKLIIQAKKQVWFAWVDLTTKKGGNTFLTSPDRIHELDSNNPIAFHFGNGLLNINVDGKNYEYNDGKVMYLLYKPGSGFQNIDRKEYNSLTSTTSKAQSSQTQE